MRNGGKTSGGGARSKPLPGAGALPVQSSLIGGISNRPSPPSFKKPGKVGSFCEGGVIPEHKPGGFRNAAMEHKR